jgi:Cupin-like domain
MAELLRLDPERFRECFNRRAFSVGHTLAEGGLFAIPKLASLAAHLPARQVEYNAGDVPVNLDPALTPQNGLGPAETVRRIEECNSWMVLKNVETVPEYARLLEACLAEIAPHSEALAPGMHMAEAFVFVSSPGSVTPFHIDPEHNFLFQIRGCKTMHVFDPADRELVAGEDLERFYSGAHRNLRFREHWQSRAEAFELVPGRGVHVPVTAPHWVRNGAGVSVSFSVTFRSSSSKRQADVWQMNGRLRRLGLRPRPAGASHAGDLAKQALNRLLRFSGDRARSLLPQPLTRRRLRPSAE